MSVPSLRMWREYFPNAHIFGLDICDFSQFETDWFTFYRVDCGQVEDFCQVTKAGGQFDIIIDDGSHASFHQQLAFAQLFPTLRSGPTILTCRETGAFANVGTFAAFMRRPASFCKASEPTTALNRD